MGAYGAGLAMLDDSNEPRESVSAHSMEQMTTRRYTLLNKYWRVSCTGLSFAAFGIGGLGLRVLVFPLINLLIRKQERRTLWARHVIRLTFRLFIDFMRILGVLRYNITGMERLQRHGLLILANHPSLIDTVLLMAFVRHADCIVKGAMWRNPFTRGAVSAAGYISNEDGAELVDECIASIHHGGNLIIFPEGTRTAADGIMHFKRGAANIAIRGECAITPVIIRCTPGTLGKGNKWWKVPPTVPYFEIMVQADIDITKVIGLTKNPALAARQLTCYLQNYFMKES